MKNIHKYMSLAFTAALIAVSFTSCEDEDKARFPQLTNGGFVKFVTAPEFNAGADPSTAAFVASVEDPSGNVATYDIRVAGDFTGATEDTISFKSTTTFPFDIGFTAGDMATLFNVPASTFESGDSFEFFGNVTTVDGIVYDGATTSFVPPSNPEGVEPGDDEYVDPSTPGFIPRPGQWNGNNTDTVLATAGGLLAAFNWEVEFADPTD